MSGILDVRKALNTHYSALATTTVDIVDENSRFPPSSTDRPYEVLYLLAGTPENAAMGSESAIWRVGIFQASLYYPANKGAASAAQRAMQIADHFARGLTLTSGSVRVKLTKPADIRPARLEGERYVLPVQVPFMAFDTG